MLRNFLATFVLTSSFHGRLNQITFLLDDSLLSVLKLVVIYREAFRALIYSETSASKTSLLEDRSKFLLPIIGAIPFSHRVDEVLVHVDEFASCLVEGSVQSCLQVEGHIQEVT